MLRKMGPILVESSQSCSIKPKQPIKNSKSLSEVTTIRQIGSNKNTTQPLPSQPVPPLSSTILNFLSFNQVFGNKFSKEPDKLKEAYKLCHELATSKNVEHLQNALVQRSKILSNWLTPWWLNVAYLEARTPLPIITSPGVMLPKINSSFGQNDQIELAAKLVRANLKFFLLIINGQLTPDKLGNGEVLDMSQYLNLFGTTRIPQQVRDQISYGKDLEQWPKHIIVICNGNIFYCPVQNNEGKILSIDELKLRFSKIIEQSNSVNLNAFNVCSGDNRDHWATVYQRIKKNNVESMKLLEHALFVVAFDKSVENYKISRSAEILRQSLHGGGINENLRNRWFDKTLQFCVNDLCDLYVTYEHTPAEGPPLGTLIDYIVDEIESAKPNTQNDEKITSVEEWKKLDFITTEDDHRAIQLSINNISNAINNLEVSYFLFEHFGKNVPKLAKVSPDGFIQMALQLAFYRLHGIHTPTYETASLRRFKDGRTETIRLPNDASIAFVELASNSPDSNARLKSLLIDAINEHKAYTIQAMNGQGMDRHLLGLKLMAIECGEELPKIFNSDLYKHLMQFRLSTSQVPTKHLISIAFGPSTANGYGICYNPQEKRIAFTLSTFNDCDETSCTRFIAKLDQALLDLARIVNVNNGIKSKL